MIAQCHIDSIEFQNFNWAFPKRIILDASDRFKSLVPFHFVIFPIDMFIAIKIAGEWLIFKSNIWSFGSENQLNCCKWKFFIERKLQNWWGTTATVNYRTAGVLVHMPIEWTPELSIVKCKTMERMQVSYTNKFCVRCLLLYGALISLISLAHKM